MKTLPFVPYYKTHLYYTAKLHKKQGIILVWSPNGGAIACEANGILPARRGHKKEDTEVSSFL